MTLDALLDEQFQQFSPEPMRHTANLAHLYADYVEILAVLQNGDWITTSDLVKRFKDYNVDVPSVSTVTAGPSTPAETPAEREDSYDRWSEQVFMQVEDRCDRFGADYPFEIDRKCVRLKDDITARHKIYLMLLLCSNLPYVPKLQPKLTAEFEALAAEVVKNFLPPRAIVRQLGKQSDYQGTAQDKIWALALDMDIDIDEMEVNKALGNQERGLDIVGWLPFRDRYPNFAAILAQCACGKSWYEKLHETRRYEYSYFRFRKIRPIHAIIIPRSLHYNGDLYQSDELADVLLFERSRIMELLTTEGFFDQFESKTMVEYFVELSEDIV